MIIFDFKCRKCSKIEEKLLDSCYKESKAMHLCECGGLMDKQLSAPNIILDESFPGESIKRRNKT